MTITDDVSVEVGKSLPWVVDQFRTALAECRRVEQEGGDVAGQLGTVLERLYALLEPLPGLAASSPSVRALRFARARYIHQTASLTFRAAGGASTWRPASQLPRPEDMRRHWNPNDAGEYDQLLAGESITDALNAAEQAVNAAVPPPKT